MLYGKGAMTSIPLNLVTKDFESINLVNSQQIDKKGKKNPQN